MVQYCICYMGNPTQASGERVNTNVMVSSQARQFVILAPKLTFRLCHSSSINYKVSIGGSRGGVRDAYSFDLIVFLPQSVFNRINDSTFSRCCSVRLCQESFMLSIGYWPTASALRNLRIKVMPYSLH